MYPYESRHQTSYNRCHSHQLSGEIPDITAMDAHLNSQWPFLLNAPPKAFIAGGLISTDQAGTTSRNWLTREFAGLEPSSRIAISFHLPPRTPPDPAHHLEGIGMTSMAQQKYIDYLVKEIQVFRKMLPPEARLSYIHLSNDIIELLSFSELTQLMFHIQRSFPETLYSEARVVAELDREPRSDSLLALLAGLGVNSICLNDPGLDSKSPKFEDLPYWIKTFRAYGFSMVQLRIRMMPHLIPDLDRHISRVMADQPDALLVLKQARKDTPASQQQEIEQATQRFRSQLSLARYRPLTESFFVSRNWDCGPGSSVVKGLGVGARTYTPHLELQNTGSLSQYYQMLDAQTLPVSVAQQLCIEL